jgi:hypothetical protein
MDRDDQAKFDHEHTATHIERGDVGDTKGAAAMGTGIAINDHAITLDSDELRDQMTAQVKATKLRFTSAASMQLCFFLFVAYCSKYTWLSLLHIFTLPRK